MNKLTDTSSVSPELQFELDKCNLEVKGFFVALQAEVGKLSKRIAQLEAENLVLKSRAKEVQPILEEYAHIKANPIAILDKVPTHKWAELRKKLEDRRKNAP